MTNDSSRMSRFRLRRRRSRDGSARESRFRLRRRQPRDGSVRESRFLLLRRQRRIRALRPVAISVAGLALAGFVVWVVGFSSWLAASHVAVRGNAVVSTTEVRQVARVPIGRPLVRVDLDAIRRRVERLPAVLTATVHRSWPRTISIDVSERVETAVVFRSGRWRAVDRHGVVFRVLPRRTPGYPQLVARANDRTLTADTAKLAASLPTTLASRVQQIRARTPDSIVLVLPKSRTIVWGSVGQSAEKARVASVLMKTSARSYDVSVPALPTTTR
jgi:cell division protein FtsQ